MDYDSQYPFNKLRILLLRPNKCLDAVTAEPTVPDVRTPLPLQAATPHCLLLAAHASHNG